MTSDVEMDCDYTWEMSDEVHEELDLTMLEILAEDESCFNTDDESQTEQQSTSAQDLTPDKKSSQKWFRDFMGRLYCTVLDSRDILKESRHKMLSLRHLALIRLLFNNLKNSEKLMLEALRKR